MVALYFEIYVLSFGPVFGFGFQGAQVEAVAQTDRRQIQVEHVAALGHKIAREYAAHDSQSGIVQLPERNLGFLHQELFPDPLQTPEAAWWRLQYRSD